MGIKFRGLIGPKLAGSDIPEVVGKQNDTEARSTGISGEKTSDQVFNATEASENSDDEKRDLQFGVQAAEATLQVWTRQHLIAAYIL